MPPIELNVFKPITTVLFRVVSLKYLKSAGKCHGMVFLFPITLFFATAAIIEIINVFYTAIGAFMVGWYL